MLSLSSSAPEFFTIFLIGCQFNLFHAQHASFMFLLLVSLTTLIGRGLWYLLICSSNILSLLVLKLHILHWYFLLFLIFPSLSIGFFPIISYAAFPDTFMYSRAIRAADSADFNLVTICSNSSFLSVSSSCAIFSVSILMRSWISSISLVAFFIWSSPIRSHLIIHWSSSGLKSAPNHYVHGFYTHQNREIWLCFYMLWSLVTAGHAHSIKNTYFFSIGCCIACYHPYGIPWFLCCFISICSAFLIIGRWLAHFRIRTWGDWSLISIPTIAPWVTWFSSTLKTLYVIKLLKIFFVI